MDLSLQTQQKQVLSPKMQQSAKILQMNTLALSTYLREIAEENPLLEWEEDTISSEKDDTLLQKLEWLQDADEQNRSYNQIEFDSENERENNICRKKEDMGLREYLMFQINILSVNQKNKQVLRFLVENIMESGYLEADALETAMIKFHLSSPYAEETLRLLQSLEPSGVGARNLKECLLIQLQQKNASTTAQAIVQFYLEDLGKNHLSHIAKKLHLSTSALTDALTEIKACQPKPGNGFSSHLPVEYILPDVYVQKKETDLIVVVNSGKAPRLFIHPGYKKLLRQDLPKETKTYIMQKLRQAEWAVQCVNRREETLRKTTKAIVLAQRNFFLLPKGELAPLRMQDIAKALHIHPSTVSRAVKDKYLQCEKGTFPLSYFFIKGLAHGEKQISTSYIRKQIRTLIEREDKTHPLSDRMLMEKLQEQGIDISRRTIAKYRELLQIPNTAQRKRHHR